ncbi:hypothetical protein KM043_003416 [Ampulex compressa]|nr:hypothetical protein KM043_003416 [Ampulex compressa]
MSHAEGILPVHREVPVLSVRLTAAVLMLELNTGAQRPAARSIDLEDSSGHSGNANSGGKAGPGARERNPGIDRMHSGREFLPAPSFFRPFSGPRYGEWARMPRAFDDAGWGIGEGGPGGRELRKSTWGLLMIIGILLLVSASGVCEW